MKNTVSLLTSIAVMFLIFSSAFALSNERALSLADNLLLKTSTSLPTLLIDQNTSFPVSVGAQMLYLEDPEHTLNIDTVLTDTLPWKEIDRQSPNFGFTSTAYWFRFNLRNLNPKQTQVFIELPIPFLDDVKLYRIGQGIVKEQHFVGDQRPFPERPILHQNFVMPFTLAPGDNDMVMRISSAGTIEGLLFIWTPETFSASSDNDHLLQGIWMGIVGIMVVYNLFLYFFIRDKSYLYYVGFAFSYLMFQVCLEGYGFAYLWPEKLSWNSYAISTFVALCNLTTALFVLSFLKLKKYNRFGYWLMSAILVSSAILTLLTFIAPYSFTLRVGSGMAIFTGTLSVTFGYYAWYKGDRYAKYFCLAWTCAVGGVFILVAAKFGVIAVQTWTHNAGQVGVMMLVALLSIALANRINREKELRLKAQDSSLDNEKLARHTQAQLLKTKENANQELERKVTERTQTLEQALLELEDANKRLEFISTTDALTEIYNRGHFENQLSTEFKRAVRHQRQLSIILCDLDNFKSINDNHGHKAGDACLKKIAQIFKHRITRSGDVAARFGGEEFIVLLLDTPLERAAKIAETLRLDIRDMSFSSGEKQLNITASFGVSELDSSCFAAAEQVVHHADLALYQAKNAGRDQVICWQTPTPLDQVSESTPTTSS